MLEDRFIVEKNAHSYLLKIKCYDSELDNKGEICNIDDFSYVYKWDEDFKKYFRFDSLWIKQNSKYFSDMSLFVKNLDLNEIFMFLEDISLWIVYSLTQKASNKNSLVICNCSPIEWVLLWEVFRWLWCNNVAISLNRRIWINFSEKTFEATLIMLMYDKSNFLKRKVKEIVDRIKSEQLLIFWEKLYILIDENNSSSKYEHFWIDSYLKTQIWFKESKNVYRLDKYPDTDFLVSKNIENVFSFDSDSNPGSFLEYYQKEISSNLKKVNFENISYIDGNIDYIWHYEKYLCKQNNKYLKYKKDILQKADKLAKNQSKNINWSKINNSSNNSLFESKNNDSDNKMVKLLVSIVLIVYAWMMMYSIFSSLVNWGNSWSSTSWGSSYNYWWNYWWSYWWYNNSSWKSSTSWVSSFGWGWFSKWWG